MSGGKAVIEEPCDSKEQDFSTMDMRLTEDKTHVMMIDPKEHKALSIESKQWIAGVIDLLRR